MGKLRNTRKSLLRQIAVATVAVVAVVAMAVPGGATQRPRDFVEYDGMTAEVQFFFYLAAVLWFVLAAALAAIGSRVGGQAAFVPLGLALFVFPTLWNMGNLAFVAP